MVLYSPSPPLVSTHRACRRVLRASSPGPHTPAAQQHTLLLLRVVQLRSPMSGKPVKKAKTGGVPPAAPAPAPVTGAKRAARAAAATAHSKKSTAPPAAKRARVVAKKPVSRAAEVEEDDYLSSGTESDELDLTKTYSRAAPRRRGGADAFASSDSEAEAGSSDDSGEGSDFDEVSVEFEFRDPAEIQYKSVRRLMEHFLPGEEETFDVSGMADAIVGQVQLGTMVCVADDLDVYAFATILSVNKYRVR
ncbi:hypothetical protein EON68_03760 [archaeon]|nr:MAG: hypothetical protein EON68_03760 [archaeon]